MIRRTRKFRTLRWAFAVAAAVWALVLSGLVAGWIRSRFAADSVTRVVDYSIMEREGQRQATLTSADGVLILRLSHYHHPHGALDSTVRWIGGRWTKVSWHAQHSPATVAKSIVGNLSGRGGFSWENNMTAYQWTLNVHVISSPYWAVIAALGLLPVVMVLPWLTWSRRVKREAGGLCVKCGYDLRASQGRCPECGTPFATRAAPSSSPARVGA